MSYSSFGVFLCACIYTCLCVCACLYICLCVYACVYTFVCLCMCIYMFMCLCMGIYMFVCLCMCIYMFMCLCMFIYMFVCLCMCIYMFVCVHVCSYVCLCICLRTCMWRLKDKFGHHSSAIIHHIFETGSLNVLECSYIMLNWLASKCWDPAISPVCASPCGLWGLNSGSYSWKASTLLMAISPQLYFSLSISTLSRICPNSKQNRNLKKIQSVYYLKNNINIYV